jgi:23S rRNA pseudouridine2605 synthase
MEERLQKILAQAGLGSRRACEELILAGRVRVNGATAVIGQKADPTVDKIMFDGNAVKTPEQKIYIALHKPRMVLSVVEAERDDTRKTVRDLVPVAERLYPVGRLDFDSEGLILMTNDGDLANELTHPSRGHEKEYRVLVARHPDAEQLATWRRGVVLEDGYKTAPAGVHEDGMSGKGMWLRVVMREGRKRQIREIGSLLGLPVVRIVRVRIGTLRLGTLKAGEWRYLNAEEIAELKGKRPPSTPRLYKTTRPPVGRVAPRRSEEKPYEKGQKTGGRRPPPGSAEEARLATRRRRSDDKRYSPERPGDRSPDKKQKPAGR